MERLETRELAYYVAVAEERHFGRAAARLGMAQPPLSRAIKQLEHRLGVPLLERTSQGVLLTAAGEVLLEDARRILAATAAAAARTKRAGMQSPRLVVVLKPGADGGFLPEVLAAFAETPEAIPVDFRTCVFGEQADLLRAGEGDVALLHGYEQDLSGLDTEELSREPQVLIVSRDHPLAERAELRLADIADDSTPLWAAGSPIGRPGELLQLIALGRYMKLAPAAIRTQLRLDLAAIPVVDAPRTPLLLAWPEQHRSKALASFVQTALDVAAARSAGSRGFMAAGRLSHSADSHTP
jgi:DNA-binding transcriptional LysR family regulator